MKIAIIADPVDNQGAGIYTYTKNMIDGLIRSDSEHEYFLVLQNKHPEWPDAKQIIIPNTSLPIGWASVRLFVLVPMALRKRKVDIVIEPAHFGPFNLPSRVKRVTVIHDLTPILFPNLHRWHSQLLQKIFLRKILKKADLIITNSNHTSADLTRIYPFTKNNTETIHLGRDEFFKPKEDTTLLKNLGVKNSYFLYAGTIEPRKNLELLLEAFMKFKNSDSDDVQLIIAGGKGWKAAGFYKQLDSHPFREKIVVTGYVTKEELRVLYSGAIALIYPSMYEGFGLPVVEAMACGTPAILHHSSSLPEVGGDACLYFNNNDVQELASCMDIMATELALRKDLAQKALRQAALFSWEKYTIVLLSAIEKLTGK